MQRAVFVPDHALICDFNETFPKVIKHELVVMAMLDVSGYTQLTRRLMESSTAGYNAAENVGQTIKQCLDPIVDCVVSKKGDIVKYSGDSITVLWYDPNQIFDAVKSCVDATLLLQNQEFIGPEGEIIRLGLHSVIHTAPIHLIYVGNEKRVESVCFGREYTRMCQSLEYSTKGTILLLDAHEFTFSGFENLVTSRKVERGILLKANRIGKALNSSFSVSTERRLEKIKYYEESKSGFVDESIIARYSNCSSTSTLAEIRLVTVAFAKLSLTLEQTQLDDDAAANQFAFYLQDLFVMTVKRLAHHGILRQIAVDDKGLTIFMLFGLPPYVHETTAAPAGAVISRWMAEMKILPFTVNVGLATERVFSGLLQSRDGLRKEHALLGGAVNLAARLMMQNEKNNHIYCDATTAKGLQTILTLSVRQTPDYLELKGYEKPVPAFSVETNSDQTKEKLLKSRSLLDNRVRMDFHTESDDLAWKQRVNAWFHEYQSCTLFIQGQSGCGKTVTASRILSYCKKLQCTIWEVASYEIEALSPFHTLRSFASFLTSIFGSDWDLICQTLQVDTDLLLQTVKNLNQVFQQNKVFLGSTPKAKILQESSMVDDFQKIQTRIVEALVLTLTAVSKLHRIVICMDDCQWQDRYSWTATNAIITQCPNILVVVISRPTKEYVDPVLRQVYETLSQLPTSLHIEVGHLKLERLEAILSQLMQSNDKQRANRIAAALHEQTSGNAFALDVLLKYLMESGKLEENLESSSILPRDMTTVFISQLDKLHPLFQKMIRTAALMGQVFDLNDVVHLSELPSLPSFSQLFDWDRFEFFVQVEETRWRFRHCLIQYQIACLITSEERKLRHRAIGNYFETLLKESDNRKTELLPMVYQQYTLAEYEDGIFSSGCKLVGYYMHLDMPYDSERVFLQVIKFPKFSSLPVLKQLKIYAHGCRALDCTNNYAQGLLIFPNILKLVDLGYTKWTFLSILRIVHQIGMLKEFWKKNKIPNVEMKNCPESEISERILQMWCLFDCFFNLLGRQGSYSNFFYLQWLFTLINVSIKCQRLLPESLWVLVCLVMGLNSASMGIKEAVPRLCQMHHVNDMESSSVLKVLARFNTLSRREIAKECVFNLFVHYAVSLPAAIMFDVNMLIKTGEEIDKIVDRLDWMSLTTYFRFSYTHGCILKGKGNLLEKSLSNLRKIRLYLATHPTSSFSAFGIILNTSTFYCAFMESYGPNKEIDDEMKKDLSFMHNFVMEQEHSLNVVTLSIFRTYMILRHLFHQELTLANEQIYLTMKETAIVLNAGKSTLALTSYCVSRLTLNCLVRENVQSTLSACKKFFSFSVKMLKDKSTKVQETSFYIAKMWLILLNSGSKMKAECFVKEALNVREQCLIGGDSYTAAMISESIFRYLRQKNQTDECVQYYQEAKQYYKENGYLWSLHYLDQETRISLID